MTSFSSIPEALDALKQGKMIIVVDDEERENEGDLIFAAQSATPEKLAFMIRHTGGVVCLPLSNAIADRLELPAMVERNTSAFGTPFTVSIEAKEGVSTGISAADRARTILTAMNPEARPDDLSHPGHVFPLRAKEGGVLARAGHTEASIDLCAMAGLRKGAVLSELMHDDGTMMRLPALQAFSAEHNLCMISIADLIAYRRQTESFITKEASSPLETETGLWQIHVYRDTLANGEHIVLTKGEITSDAATLVRVHSECFTGDVLHSTQCDCGDQLTRAMKIIEREGSGAILYMRQEGRGIGLINKIRAYALQQSEGLDTVEANERLGFPMDLREYGIGAQILKDIGLGKIRLLTNNPKKMAGLEGFGLEIVEQLPILISDPSPKQRAYLETKRLKMGHRIP